jgi:hypothetical protein
MKQLVLLLFFFLPLSLFAGFEPYPGEEPRPGIFPNPAMDYVSISNDASVEQMAIYNFAGRMVCSFPVSKGGQYNVSNLPTGMYLVQFLDGQERILHTQRMQKR